MNRSFIVVGLGYGDEGKGSWVDHLVRLHGLKQVMRFNGGAQAAHHVVTPEQTLHCFAQFGSGMFVPGTKTLLSRFMLIEPQALLKEATVLESKGVLGPLNRVIVSENAPIITPFNRLLNRMREIQRGVGRHGSCGFGIGETQSDVETLAERALYVRDIANGNLRSKLEALWQLKRDAARELVTALNGELLATFETIDLDYFERLYTEFYYSVQVVREGEFQRLIRENDSVFEGAQGVLLDQQYGFFPHCTRSNTTFENAETLLAESGYSGKVERIGLLRGYATRHGAGPLVSEDTSLELAPCHNGTNPWQGQFRIGWFDAVAARYAIEVVGDVDTLAITNLDRMQQLSTVKIVTAYDGGDARFHSAERIFPIAFDKAILTERTEALGRVIPRFEELAGWKGEGVELESYLERIEQLLGTKISAFSLTAGHRKSYRGSRFSVAQHSLQSAATT